MFLPQLRVVHHESKTRGDDLASTASDRTKKRYEKEYQLLRDTWPEYIANDPYYNPNLTKHDCNYSINTNHL